MAETRDTIGKIATELMEKIPESRDPIELERAMHADYDKHLYDAIARGFREYHGDFYVVVDTKKERLLENVLRNYFYCRSTCPTPTYDQTVYKYHRKDENIEFIWVIPSKDTCQIYRDHCLEVDPEERDLLQFVLEFYDGSLLRKCKILNNEESASNILLTR
jgi:hypothetical protein